MPARTGKQGTISYAGGHVATINNWSLDTNNGMHDVTSFSTGTVQWREYIAGLSDWSGSIDGVFNPASTGQGTLISNTLSPTTAAIVLEMDKETGGSYTGSCLLESMGVSVGIDGTVDMSWSFQGTATLSYSTST